MCFDRFTDCLEIYRLFADIQTVFFFKESLYSIFLHKSYNVGGRPKSRKSVFSENTYELLEAVSLD